MNVALWLERFDEALRLRGFTENTRTGYGYTVRRFLEFLCDRQITMVSEISRQEVDAYRVHLHHWRKANGEPLTLSAQSAKLGAVLSFLRYLHEEKLVLVKSRPTACGCPRRADKLLPQLPDEAQISGGSWRAPDESTPLGLRDRAILELLYSSAIRNTELRLLELDHVDLVRLEARIECGKGRKGRVVPFGEPGRASHRGLFARRSALVGARLQHQAGLFEHFRPDVERRTALGDWSESMRRRPGCLRESRPTFCATVWRDSHVGPSRRDLASSTALGAQFGGYDSALHAS